MSTTPYVSKTGRIAVAGATGRVVLEDAACRHCLETLRQHAADAGFDIVSFDSVTRRLMLAPR